MVSFLGNGPLRFTELKRGVDGISQRMLTVTLRGLERDGILTRTVYNAMPPHVVYELTDMGTSLLDGHRAADRVERRTPARYRERASRIRRASACVAARLTGRQRTQAMPALMNTRSAAPAPVPRRRDNAQRQARHRMPFVIPQMLCSAWAPWPVSP